MEIFWHFKFHPFRSKLYCSCSKLKQKKLPIKKYTIRCKKSQYYKAFCCTHMSLISYLGRVLLLLIQKDRTWETLTQFIGTAQSTLISFSAPEFHCFDGQRSWGNVLFSFSAGWRALLRSCLSAFETHLILSFYFNTLLLVALSLFFM